MYGNPTYMRQPGTLGVERFRDTEGKWVYETLCAGGELRCLGDCIAG